MTSLGKGLVAGAVGTQLLNAVTYLDMALTGRSSSSIPEEDVQKLADRVGLSLGEDASTAGNRRTAVGALMGYLTGSGLALTYGVVRRALPPLPAAPAAVLVALGAMTATNAGNVALGATDPRSWSAHEWLADLVPHLAYGTGVVLTYDALERG